MTFLFSPGDETRGGLEEKIQREEEHIRKMWGPTYPRALEKLHHTFYQKMGRELPPYRLLMAETLYAAVVSAGSLATLAWVIGRRASRIVHTAITLDPRVRDFYQEDPHKGMEIHATFERIGRVVYIRTLYPVDGITARIIAELP